MNKPLMALMLTLMIAGCGDTKPEDNRREVEKDARTHSFAPIDVTDDALQTEAVTMMGTIHRQVKLKAAVLGGGQRQQLYKDISGALNDAKLQKIGMNAALLRGSYYVAGDYHLSFAGNKMTITAAKPGTRGRVEPKTYSVP